MKYILMLVLLHALVDGCFCKRYKVSLLNIEDCKDPELAYASPLPFKLILEMFNSSKGYNLLRGNLTVPKDIPGQDKRGTFSSGKETSTGIEWILTMKKLDCRNFVAKAIIGGFGVPLKGCVLKKGLYTFKDIDVDAIDSAFIMNPARVDGAFVTRATITSATETLCCWVSHFEVVHLTKTRG